MEKNQSKPASLVPAKRDAADFLNSEQVRHEVAKVLPKHVTPERMTRVALTAVLKSPQLIQAIAHPMGKASLLSALMVCSQAGLEPDGRLAHLIPFWNSKGNFFQVQVIFDWKGLVTLAQRNGYETVFPDMVCANDHFEAWVEDGVRKILHKVDWRKPRGEPYLFYCITRRNGITDYEIMTIEECDDIRAHSKANNAGPWVDYTNEMRKKCPIRRMSKRWDLLPEIREALFSDYDTPEPLDQPKVSAPIFQTRLEKLAELDKSIPEKVVEEFVAEPPIKNGATVDHVRKLCAEAQISEGALLEYLAELGAADKVATLEALMEKDPMAINSIWHGWHELLPKFHAWVEESR